MLNKKLKSRENMRSCKESGDSVLMQCPMTMQEKCQVSYGMGLLRSSSTFRGLKEGTTYNDCKLGT